MLAFLAAGESSTLPEAEDGRFLRLEALSSTDEVLGAIDNFSGFMKGVSFLPCTEFWYRRQVVVGFHLLRILEVVESKRRGLAPGVLHGELAPVSWESGN
jgi:hypothetical protein